jgi:hypothetical protein
MRKPIHITAPRPSHEEIARRFRVSKASEKALQDLVDEFKAVLSDEEQERLNSTKSEKRRKRASAA